MNFATSFFLAMLWAGRAWASEAHGPSINDIWFPLINFLIFLYLIKRFALPVARDYFRTRHEDISRSVSEATAARERAEARAQEYRDRLARLTEEVKKIHEAFIAEGERERAKLVQEAEAQAAKLKADADFLAGQELKVAELQVRREMARLAHASAENAIRVHLTPGDNQRLVDEFLAGLGGAR
jgi:F-type H+-transporting ATPase subunit b